MVTDRIITTALSFSFAAAALAAAQTPPVVSGLARTNGSAKADVGAAQKHASDEPRFWIYLSDKGVAPGQKAAAIASVAAGYDAHAVERRRLRGLRAELFDETDLPVADAYLGAIRSTGAQIHTQSRWLNAISVWATPAQLDALRALPFVTRVTPVAASRRPQMPEADDFSLPDPPAPGGIAGGIDHGQATNQQTQINLIALHDAGFTGAGMRIGILDTGFVRTHEAFNQPGHPVSIIAEHDFINDDGNAAQEEGDPADQFHHGTWILGVLGAYKPGTLVGAAFDASFILCKTEDVSGETQIEEDNYVAGLEFCEMNGADVVTASLGYIDWYTQADLDGHTAVTTIGVNQAIANGLICCNAAGNEGHDDDPATSSIIAPADAYKVISCGAVWNDGTITSFSSSGPTADGRVKPEILARGQNTRTVSINSDTQYSGVSGTSLSTPLVSGAVTCVLQARPAWNVNVLRARLFHSASDFVANGAFDPLFIRGYGILNAADAVNFVDCDGDSVDDLPETDSALAIDVDANGAPDVCDHLGDMNCDGVTDNSDIDAFVLVLLDRAAFATAYPGCYIFRADTNGDGLVDNSDIDGFVQLLLGP